MDIYVSNLGEKITEESLGALFSTYGQVDFSKVFFNGLKEISFRYAFIKMPNRKEAQLAVTRLHGSIINGKVLKVECTAINSLGLNS